MNLLCIVIYDLITYYSKLPLNRTRLYPREIRVFFSQSTMSYNQFRDNNREINV